MQDNGINSPDLVKLLGERINAGATALTFISHNLIDRIVPGGSQGSACGALPFSELSLTGRSCNVGKGHFYQIDQPFYQDFNSDAYGTIPNVAERRKLLDGILGSAHIAPILHVAEGADRLVAFGRRGTLTATKADPRLWITAKSGRLAPVSAHLVWSEAVQTSSYKVTDVFKHTSTIYSGQSLATVGFNLNLEANGSTAFMIEPSTEAATFPSIGPTKAALSSVGNVAKVK